ENARTSPNAKPTTGNETEAAPIAPKDGRAAVNLPQIVRYLTAETNLCTKDFSPTDRQVSNASRRSSEITSKRKKIAQKSKGYGIDSALLLGGFWVEWSLLIN